MTIELPDWLLPHQVTAFPYLSWGVYGDAALVQCMIHERLGSGGPVGTERVGYITVIARLDAWTRLAQGSRVVLPDGREGYVSTAVRHDGGGLPTPDHVEAAVSVASAYGPPFGERVVVLHRVTTYEAGSGSAQVRHVPTVYDSAAVRPLTSSETTPGSNVTVDTVEVILPPGAQVGARDAMEVRGLIFDVDGVPVDVDTSTSNARPGVRVIGKRRR